MTSLPKSTLGRTGLVVTKLGYGAMELRGTDHFPKLEPKAASAILNSVLDCGVNYIDTSPDYGYSEELIGEHISGRRSEYYLASKCGCPIEEPDKPHGQREPHDYSRANVRAGVEQSLKRMKTDYLDVVQFHVSPARDVLEKNDSVAELLKMKDEGKLRFIGISATIPELKDHIAMGVFDVFQIPYSVVEREHEDLIHEAAAKGAGIVIRGGLSRAIMIKDESVIDTFPPFLQSAFRARRKLWQETKIDDLLDGMTPMEFMLRFTISNPDLATTIIGTAHPDHRRSNAKVAEKGPLPADLYAEVCKRFPKQAAEEVV